VFFGSALKNFGVGDLLDAIGELAPPPRPAEGRQAHRRARRSSAMTAFVFKIQANMDPNTATAWLSCACAPDASSAACAW
jgi:peptide chain release factor 3